MDTIDKVIAWTGISGPTSAAFLAKLEATGGEHPRLLARMSEEEVNTLTDSIRVGDPSVPLGLLQKHGCLLVAHVCRVAVGVTASRTQQEQAASEAVQRATQAAADARAAAEASAAAAQHAASRAPEGAPSAANPDMVELSTTTDQTSKVIIKKASADTITNHYKAYMKAMGGRAPDPDSECSEAQISGMDHVLNRVKACPYVDFGVYGPNHHRLLKRMRFTGIAQNTDGSSRVTELLGPGDFHSWAESYELLQTNLLGFEAVGLGTLMAYRKKQEYYWNLYGAETWGIQYQADVRCRLEHMPRLRRRLEADYAVAKAAGRQAEVPFKESAPWDSVWDAAIKDTTFWTDNFERSANLVLSRAQSAGSHVDGDAPVAPPGQSQVPAPPVLTHCSPAGPEASQWRKRPREEDSEGRDVQRRLAEKAHNVKDGHYVTNRSCVPLCHGFQTGQCVNRGRGLACERNPNFVHQCSKCLDTRHGSSHPSECGKQPAPPSQPQRLGGGKGRGGGGKGGPRGRR